MNVALHTYTKRIVLQLQSIHITVHVVTPYNCMKSLLTHLEAVQCSQAELKGLLVGDHRHEDGEGGGSWRGGGSPELVEHFLVARVTTNHLGNSPNALQMDKT